MYANCDYANCDYDYANYNNYANCDMSPVHHTPQTVVTLEYLDWLVHSSRQVQRAPVQQVIL